MLNLTVREALNRYGPIMAVLLALLLLVAVVPGGGRDRADLTAGTGPLPTSGEPGSLAGAGTGTGAVSAGTPPAAGGAGGPTGGTVTAGGGTPGGSDTGAPPPPAGTECREDGKMPGFSHLSPPCVPVFTGDNGGTTAQGVTGDTIEVVAYLPNLDPVFEAAVNGIGAGDPPEVWRDVILTLTRYFNLHFETYKRAVNITFYQSKAAADDDAAHQAEAAEIATTLKPFAVFGAVPSIGIAELAARRVICVCNVSGPREDAKRMSPYVWGVLPHLEEFYEAMADYTTKRLAGRPARWAGDLPPTLRTEERKFGLIYIEAQGDPAAKEAADYYEGLLAAQGVKLSRRVAYTFDLSRSQEQATNIMVQMKDAGVSNVACVCDPLYPIFLTQAATEQQYFPEWFIMGSFLTDTTFFGRTYDKLQWSHAFGISPLYVFWENIEKSVGYREYHHMKPGAQPGDEGTQINIIEAQFPVIWGGIQGAGPNLTADTFAKGLFDMPPLGGVPASPLFDFSPDSYMADSDFTEVFWHASGSGKDETGKDGTGILLKTDAGRRYRTGEWPATEPKVFDLNGSVFTSDEGSTFDHDADGHTHPEDQRCRSCS